MRAQLAALLAGLLFGVGLCLAGMTQPRKIIEFLDFAGSWDPSLALVMLGALGVHAPLQALIRRRPAPVLDACFHVPGPRPIDRKLLAGSALFGVGWGLAGFCPGPALVSLPSLQASAWVFVGAMAAGMLLQHVLVSRGGMAA
ncbi:MAG: YeeE/YedE family protein [Myxococcales bacterium]|nr:YeeE/YedE family protein [Myxococcota bacterium]MDW8282984.1 YeeE/YedE family protein [Myxococcales bacterium]